MLHDVGELNLDMQEHAALSLLDRVIGERVAGEVALVSSFGAESAVLLHLVSRIDPDTPVIFIDTEMLFQETLDYQIELAELLGLTDIRRITPDPVHARREDVFGRLHLSDTDSCCSLRKVEPLTQALHGFSAWISGRKRHQSASRAGIELFEQDARHIKINPLAHWGASDTRTYMRRYALPAHPLAEKGFASIGCAPCTRAVAAGEDPRAGRWAGSDKTECGIHFAGGKVIRPAA